ncbi:MAG: hypothetical protein ACYSWS_06295 [Planctomycetota bacterium]|jgi:hypothetical protein
MNVKEPQEESARRFKLALPLMNKYSIPLTPENYKIWYCYVSGINKELRETVDSIIKNKAPFSEKTNEMLYLRFFIEKPEEMKFGEYLVKKGKIKKNELENALKFQTEGFIIIGEMAINENVLNKEQVNAILDIQRVQGGSFGDIAVKLGFLKKGELEEHLLIHSERFLIGEKLVSYGAISKEDMEEELKQYHDWKTSRKIMHGLLDRKLLDY